MLKVTIPVQLSGRDLFSVEFKVTAVKSLEQWHRLRPELIVDGVVTIPLHLFCHTRAVSDKLAYVWRSGVLEQITMERPIRPGGIFLAAESPHKAEFNEQGMPTEPLRDQTTRSLVETHLPRLIQQTITKERITLNDVDVVLGNPIQFQCSLQSLLRDPRIGLQPAVRNAVWRNLFRKRVCDLEPIKDDFKARVRRCAPELLILAPTSDVRRDLCRCARSLASHVVEIRRHPCVWNNATCVAANLSCAVTRAAPTSGAQASTSTSPQAS